MNLCEVGVLSQCSMFVLRLFNSSRHHCFQPYNPLNQSGISEQMSLIAIFMIVLMGILTVVYFDCLFFV